HRAANSAQTDVLRSTGEAGGSSRTKNDYRERNCKLVPGVSPASELGVGRCGRGCLTHTPPSPSENSLDLRTVKLEYLGPSTISRTTKSEKTSPSSRQCQREVGKGKGSGLELTTYSCSSGQAGRFGKPRLDLPANHQTSKAKSKA